VNDNEKSAVVRHLDYSAPAELYMLSARGSRGRASEYRRFPSAAEAIRYAIEELPAQLLVGVVMEVGEDRFDHKALQELYDRQVALGEIDHGAL
jgi:hypothetical protein